MYESEKNVMSAHFEITKKGTEVVKISLCLDNKPLYFIFCTRRDLYYATHRWILKKYCQVTISMIWLTSVPQIYVYIIHQHQNIIHQKMSRTDGARYTQSLRPLLSEIVFL